MVAAVSEYIITSLIEYMNYIWVCIDGEGTKA